MRFSRMRRGRRSVVGPQRRDDTISIDEVMADLQWPHYRIL